MNNNNRGNNRRRGRGNNNNGRQGGGQQLNRIDSRARGNAPQLLEKYRKLALDAHLNGDRVTEEYNLQFADHYFRVIADARVRQEEQRGRRDERWEGGNEPEREEGDFASEYTGESDYTSYDQPHRREREERAPRQDDRTERQERPERGERQDRPERTERPERPERAERPRRAERPAEPRKEDAGEGTDGDETAQPSAYEPTENPFVRENRGTRGLRPRRDDRRPRRDDRAADNGDEAPAGLDPSMLPPAISVSREEAPEPEEQAAKPKPKPRTRRPKPPADDAGEALEAVS